MGGSSTANSRLTDLLFAPPPCEGITCQWESSREGKVLMFTAGKSHDLFGHGRWPVHHEQQVQYAVVKRERRSTSDEGEGQPVNGRVRKW
jgi:hypothetical protein